MGTTFAIMQFVGNSPLIKENSMNICTVGKGRVLMTLHEGSREECYHGLLTCSR